MTHYYRALFVLMGLFASAHALEWYEETVASTNGGNIYVGSDIGTLTDATMKDAVVKKLVVYTEIETYDDDTFGNDDRTILSGMEVTFTKGVPQLYGKKGNSFQQVTFTPGEKIKGDVIICDNGEGANTGYLAFNDFKVGDNFSDIGESEIPRTQFKFDGANRILTGFTVYYDTQRIRGLGPIFSKKITSSTVTDIVYLGLDEDAEIPPSSIRASAEFSYDNNQSIDGEFQQTFEIAESSTHSFSSEETSFINGGLSVSTTVKGTVPGVVDIEGTAGFTVDVGTSTTTTTAEETQTVERKVTTFTIPAAKRRTTKAIVSQAEYSTTLPYNGVLTTKFLDGSDRSETITGEYAGTLVSKNKVTTRQLCLDGSEEVGVAKTCPGDQAGPSPSPPTSSDPDEEAVCFPGNALVQVLHKGPTPMQDLRVNDKVLTSHDHTSGHSQYQEVYAFGHRSLTESATFYQIGSTTDNNKNKALEISGRHLLYVAGKANPVTADSIKVGDKLVSGSSGRNTGVPSVTTVTKISTVVRTGVYAPFTPSGTIVVDGVVASSYSSFQKQSGDADSSEYFQLNKGSVIINHASLEHLYLSPFRMLCMGVSSQVCQVYDAETGTPVALSFGWKMMQNCQSNLLLQTMFLLVSMPLMMVFFAMEWCLGGAAWAPLVVLLSWVMVVCAKQTNAHRSNALLKIN